MEASNRTAGSSAPSDPSRVFCSIIVRSESKELCLDIAGESPAPQTPLLGFDCTGRWNQQFSLGENCTIIAEQPAVVGRIRGTGEGSIKTCLDSRHGSNILMSAVCDHLTSANYTSVVQVPVAWGGDVEEMASNGITEGGHRNFTTGQQYQFMPADGNAFKQFMKR